MRSFMKKWIVLAACGTFLWSGAAHAVPEFPEQLQKAIPELKCPPPCTLCHDTPAGGSGTANKPFGIATVEAQAFAGDGLAGAITRMEDGTKVENGPKYLERLRLSSDPNSEAENVDICGPTYGCGARIEPRGNVDAFGALAAFGVALLLLRSRRRQQ
jgi:hypothetical protein